MNWLFESSVGFWLLLIVLVLLGVLLAVMWASTARREPLLGAAVAIGLLPVLWITERMVITDREAIEATLHQIASNVEHNERGALLAHIHPSVPWLKLRAEGEMPNYTFTACKVNKIHEIRVAAGNKPRSAEAEFNVYVSGSFRLGSQSFDGDFPRYVALKLQQDANGRWRVLNYAHADPLRGFRQQGELQWQDELERP